MAVIYPVTLTLHQGSRDFLGCVRIQYQNVKAGDTCEPVKVSRYADRSVQVTGTASGATVSIQGTCEDDTNYAVLTAADGLDLSGTTFNRTKFITEVTAYTKPVITGGDVSTDVTVTFICRGQVA
jgi:hypothetical protein